PNGRRLASSSWDNTVKLWEADTGQLLRTVYGHMDDVRGVCFSPDGKHFLSAGHDGAVKLWRADTGQLALGLKSHVESVCDVAFSPDGSRLLSATPSAVLVWALVWEQPSR